MEHSIHKQTEMLAQETACSVRATTMPVAVTISAPPTLQGHRLSGLSPLIFTGSQSRISADRSTTMGFPLHGGRLGQDTRGQKSLSRLNNPFLTAGQQQGSFLSLETEDSFKLFLNAEMASIDW